MSYLNKYQLDILKREFEACKSDEKMNFLLMTCVLATANNDVYAATQKIPTIKLTELMPQPNCQYWSIQRYGLEAARMLGRLLRKSNDDITQSRLWKLVDKAYQSEILQKREFNRRKVVGLPTYQQVCSMIDNRNTIISNGFTAVAGGSIEADDDYGCLTYFTRWRVKQENVASVTLVDSKYQLSMHFFRLLHSREPFEYEVKEAAKFLDSWWSHHLEPSMNIHEKISLVFGTAQRQIGRCKTN
jgi:hypothetical protein